MQRTNTGGVYFSANRYINRRPESDGLWPRYNDLGIVTFDNVLLNLGDGFDKTTGEFRAPKNGVYQFIFTLYFDTTFGNKNVKTYLFLNDKSFSKRKIRIYFWNCEYCPVSKRSCDDTGHVETKSWGPYLF